MNYKKAKKILNINNDNFDFKLLKHNYYKLALINHPDKSNDLNSKEKFQDITLAFNYMKNYLNNKNNINFDCEDESLYSEIEKNNSNDDIYNYLYLLLKFILSLNYEIDITSQDIQHIFNNLNYDYIDIIKKNINLLSRENIKKIYINLINADISLDNELIKILQDILKLYKTKIYKINPTIDNILNNDICCLTFNEQKIYIPLWYNEINLNLNNEVYIIQCIPNIQSNMFIDDENNLYYNLDLNFKNLLENKDDKYNFKIGTHNFNIKISDLKLKKNQIIVLKNQGISKPCHENIFDISKKCDIILNINFV